MRTRGQDAEDVIQPRLANAREEMAHAGEFDYAIINKDFDSRETCRHRPRRAPERRKSARTETDQPGTLETPWPASPSTTA